MAPHFYRVSFNYHHLVFTGGQGLIEEAESGGGFHGHDTGVLLDYFLRFFMGSPGIDNRLL
jgi:hypothetical protein